MQQTARFNSFTDACEHFLFTLATDTPLTEVQAKLVAYYCNEISSKIHPRLGGNIAVTNTSQESHNKAA